ncbi:MAG: asparagine synthase (glutamine-hydrolyzing) [Magnetovibrio sp.]|nr:asparagine synthase (glutamine-hydrolyzing) [Magnetovibrio sp.]
MCGIAGINLNQPSANILDLVEGMAQRIAHRGPDDHGNIVTSDQCTALAHRRLSIIDLSTHGRQPLVNEDQSLSLICNGEIYNHNELRRQLQSKGHQFRSHSDSEVILHLYEEMGADCLTKLDGMFAFIILDHSNGQMFCARDPLGKKPLFYAKMTDGIAVASEIPALLSLPNIDLSYDKDAIGLFLLRNIRNIPDPLTLYKSVRSLSPGHAMTIARGQVINTQTYWQPSFTPERTQPNDVLEAFDRAVAQRSIADVEVGALLSGGVDSTAIVDSLNRQGATAVRTYAFGSDKDDEELVRARKAADMLGTRHSEFYFDAQHQHHLFDEVLTQHGQPIMALPLTHAHMLFEAIHNDGLKVVLAGHGADEAFYGYDGAQNLLRLSNLDQKIPSALTKPLARTLLRLFDNGQIGDALRVFAHDPGNRKIALYKHEAQNIWPGLFNTQPSSDAISNWVQPWFKHGAPKAYIDEAAYLGLVQENAHAITISGDLPAMAHGVEVRCPFMDRHLINLALTTPYADKVRTSSDQSGGKLILKRALQERLPHDLLYAPKRGFGYFVQEETVLRGPWKHHVDKAFTDPFDFDGLLNVNALKKIKSNFDHRSPNTPTILMAKLYALQRFAQLGIQP